MSIFVNEHVVNIVESKAEVKENNMSVIPL